MLVKASVGCGEGGGVSGCWPWVPFRHEEHESRMDWGSCSSRFYDLLEDLHIQAQYPVET